MMDHINSYRRKKLNGKSPYEAFCFYYGKDLADKLGCQEVAANSINLTPGLLKKQQDNLNMKPPAGTKIQIPEDVNFGVQNL